MIEAGDRESHEYKCMKQIKILQAVLQARLLEGHLPGASVRQVTAVPYSLPVRPYWPALNTDLGLTVFGVRQGVR